MRRGLDSGLTFISVRHVLLLKHIKLLAVCLLKLSLVCLIVVSKLLLMAALGRVSVDLRIKLPHELHELRVFVALAVVCLTER